MKPTYLFILLACAHVSCSSIQTLAVQKGSFPFLGTIGKEGGNMLRTEFTPIGHPVLSRDIALGKQFVPFTKNTFKKYLGARESVGRKSSINFVDTLKNRPTYMTLTVRDRIGLRELLNEENNQEVKRYLEKDADYRLVSSISVVLDSKTAKDIYEADGVFLSSDDNDLFSIIVIRDNTRGLVRIPKDEIFDYGHVGFCWGADRYGKPMIETLSDTGGCPKGTAKNPEKLEELQSFLKL